MTHFRTLSDQQAAQVLWDYMQLGQSVEKADVIVVPGCYDPDCATYAAELYLQGFAPVMVVSGGVVPQWQDENYKGMTEAQVFAQIAIAKGVPAEKILVENRATNTSENLWFTEELLQQQNIKADKIILVQKPSFERRLYATAKHRWPGKEIIVTSRPTTMIEQMNKTDHQRAMSSLVGDFQRLETYRGTYLAEETIPTECWTAFDQLIQSGYTGYLCEPAEQTLIKVGYVTGRERKMA